MGLYDDPNRSAGGQFHNLRNATVDDQYAAGVTQYDSILVAQAKVQTYRTRNNLDFATGVALNQTSYSSSSESSYSDRDESQIGDVLIGLIKVVFVWPLICMLVMGGLIVGAAFAGRSMDGPTLAARAAQSEFASYELSPLSNYFSPKELASPVTPEGFMVLWNASKINKSTDQKAFRTMRGQAYRCLLQTGCRDTVSKIAPFIDQELSLAASEFFLEMIRAGNEHAVSDVCLFAVKTGTSYRDMLSARTYCAQAAFITKGSKAAPQAMAMLDGSWSLRKAELYYLADHF